MRTSPSDIWNKASPSGLTGRETGKEYFLLTLLSGNFNHKALRHRMPGRHSEVRLLGRTRWWKVKNEPS